MQNARLLINWLLSRLILPHQVRGKVSLANANLNGLDNNSDGEWLAYAACNNDMAYLI